MTFDRCFGCMQKLERPDEICPHCGFDINQDDEERFALRPGTILQGRYVVGKVLGKGGFGITYIGYDMSLDIRVAIKEYYPEGFVGRDARQSAKLNWYNTRTGVQNVIKSRDSLIKEARNMAKIDTLPTLVRVRDVLVANETAYLVMDYVEGETLKNLVMKTGTLSYEKVCTYLLPIMEDLSKIHEKGIIHRDISPDNIMIEANEQMRLLDLGAAKDLYRVDGIQGKANEQVPASTQMVLKHGFSPMEQYRIHGGIGPWTDVYAMTATIYYLMSGKILPTPMDRLDKEQEDAVQNIINKLSMPENAKEGMQKGLAILKDDRIKSMEELQKYFSLKKVEPKIEQKSELKVELKSKKLKKSPVFLLVGIIVIAGVAFTGIKLSHKSAEKYYEEGNYEQALETYRQEKDEDGVKKTTQTMYDAAYNYLSGENGYEKNEEEAVKYYKLVAENANSEDLKKNSCYYLGYIMLKNETEEDNEEAAIWFEKASEKGDMLSKDYLSIMYSEGTGVLQDQKKAVELLEEVANSGEDWAITTPSFLGMLYESGKFNDYVQEIDYVKALNWYKKAEENNVDGSKESVQRVLKAIYEMANNYRTGENGYAKNETEAIKYYKLVAEDTDAEDNSVMDACYFLGKIMSNNETKEDDEEAASWYEKAVEEGDISAMNNLAYMYECGVGVSQDYEKALELYKQAADCGLGVAMTTMGTIYWQGLLGQEIDNAEAVKWYEKAIENGDAAAMNYLAYMYEHGEGVSKDNEKALELYEEAVENGSVSAMNNLAYMYEHGEGVPKDNEKALELYEQAADEGESAAMVNIGYNYEFGECGQQMDLKKALEWYKKAEEQGYDAKELIQRVQSKLDSDSNTSDSKSQKGKLVLE
ncbi:serine/threonine-protein kinase [Blautia sp. MSJ-9]|uniref:serine/threonine-protein kinase n=1 Tax=Blautia sp. MSJ-9 TaxID=2841511 RepID=UPI001C0F6799|nr:serine/threonine-protein kinase [Blautia sp. MSJ-9]MBU5679197.1 SEL1-like repeat protein [Blautia sp. MSJ-9]